ncbi:MAG: TonB-dependent receptor, partial [Gemmatimonadota bacterium]|nr:TonB-dependent receptor [Gemmatimonadota bacterium]
TPSRYALNMSPNAGLADVTWGGATGIGDPVDRYDIQDQIFRTAFGTNNRITISGGSAETQFFLSGSYRKEEGIVRPTDYSRANIRANITQQISDKFTVTARSSVMQSTTNYVVEGEQTQGVLTSVIFTPTAFDPNFDDNLGRYPYNPILGANPLNVIESFETPEKIARFTGGVEADFRPSDNLRIRYVAGIDDYRQEAKYFRPPYSLSAGYTGSIQNPVRLSRQFNNDLTATHIAATDRDMTFTTTAGFRYTSDRGESLWLSASDMPFGANLVSGATQFASQGYSEYHTMGWFLEEQVNYQDRLYLTAGLNREASSAFGASERWQMFPRVGISYLLGETDFWQSKLGNTISSFRLRAAYGQTGGQPPTLYSGFNHYADVAFAGMPGLVPSSVMGNSNLKPERQAELEAGFEAGLFDDRAQLELTYYDKTVTDLVMPIPLPPSTGFSSQFQNIGTLGNSGLEIALNTVNIDRPGFSWSSRIQYATNNNVVEQLVAEDDTLVFGYLNAVIEGQSVGVFFGRVYARDASGNIDYQPWGVDNLMLPYRKRSDDGTTWAREVIGDPNPDFTASVLNTFSVGQNVEISFLLDGRFGNDVANFSRRISEYFGADKVIEREISGDTIPRTFTLNPTGRIGIYEEYIEDGSFVKLREMSVQFRVNQPWVTQLGAESLLIRLAGRNLYTWTNYTGLDPEVNLFAANTVARGVDFANTPLPRTFTFSLTLNF